MAHRTLELTLISAKDLKDVNFLSKMDVYAVATIAGDHRSQQRTPVDRDGGKNPSWNASLRFSVPAEPSAAARLIIDIIIRSDHSFGDRDVGEVHIPVKELLDGLNPGSKFVSYQSGGYGYAAVPPRKQKNNLGLGLGAGLIGGALGGMLIGDMISDDGAYDSGYDAGFDNGFDF
ncbi:hypothetical protein KSP40_PGU009865 [Platanthera guangdongensis]|uniref:C2 domain-containing protein n=1 Tax=Platanthera guangdongensis TaxID=2320717 RepID=A0ABR2MR79_9ASPA